jgi:hypothetical protein
MKKLVIIIISILGLIGCDRFSAYEDPIIANRFHLKEPLARNVSAHEIETLTASISVPSQIKLNEELTVNATLKNLTDHAIKIQHASGVFYFSIKDSNGKGVNTFVMKDLGIVLTLQGKEAITEQYSYKIEKPGSYEISAIASFSTEEGDNMKVYELKTNKIILEVVE